MTQTRRDMLTLMAAAGGIAALPGQVFGQGGDPVFDGFEAARRDQAWTLGYSDAPADGFDGVARRLHGRMPTGLSGVLHRNGPGRFSRNGWRYRHWFDGDGLVHAWRLGSGGTVSHRARFVGTRKWQLEQEAGRFLMPAFGSVPPDSQGLRGPDDMNAANTSVMMLNGELMALWEGGSGWRIDPDTLESRGPKRWAGELDGLPFSAHPKVDPDGTVWNFGQAASHDMLVLWQIGPDGALQRAELVRDIPGGMIHDFAVTDRSLVFLVGNLAFDAMRMPFLDSFRWDDSRGLRVVVLDKADWSLRRSWELPPGFLFHVGGAWEDADGTIHVDAALSDNARFAVQGVQDLMRGALHPDTDGDARLNRITLQPGGRYRVDGFGDGFAEFPQVDPRRVGLARRYTWHIGWQAGQVEGAREVVRRDLASGQTDRFIHPDGTIVEEPLFIPDGSGEGEGWIIHTALNLTEAATELHVFDALNLADGPAASWRLPYACPLGFHGCWRNA